MLLRTPAPLTEHPCFARNFDACDPGGPTTRTHGSYAVLAPDELEPAGLGCGLAVEHLGSATPNAYTIDCELQEQESLAIVAMTRDVLP